MVTGGETPINSSIALASEIKRRAPDFYDKLSKRGIRYVYRYGKEDVVSTTGTSVFGAYGQQVLPTDDAETAREKIEAEVRRHSNNFEWHEDGSLTVTHTVPCKSAWSPDMILKTRLITHCYHSNTDSSRLRPDLLVW